MQKMRWSETDPEGHRRCGRGAPALQVEGLGDGEGNGEESAIEVITEVSTEAATEEE
jgi:hypothetical protein